jgi:hypothetical protein
LLVLTPMDTTEAPKQEYEVVFLQNFSAKRAENAPLGTAGAESLHHELLRAAAQSASGQMMAYACSRKSSVTGSL